MSAKPRAGEMRSIVSQGVIALMVCIGAYMFLVDPQAAKLAAAKAEEESLTSRARAAESLRDLAPQLTAALAKAKEEADLIQNTGRLARQEKELYAALTSVANTCRVRIDQMAPVKVNSAKPGQKSHTTVENIEGSANAAAGYSIDATAAYGDMAIFLQSIRTELGYSIVKSVRLTPTMDMKHKLVHALIETEHFSFDASPVVVDPNAAPADSGGNR